VPAPLQSPATAAQSRQRGILLLESYDALAAAIGSALKKFAPEHKIDIAPSLADAEKLAAQNPPELFVIDVDPSWPGITDFLETMRENNPTARALVIGGKIPDEIAAERKLSGALQFVAKPFELPEFGAAVQALLGPWSESESTGPRENLAGLNPIDLLLVHHAAEANVIVDLSAGPGFSGEIHIATGQVSHAATANLTGLDALREILSWPDARMSERKIMSGLHREVLRRWVEVVLEAVRSKPPAKPPVAEPEKAAPPKPRAKTGKKIVVIDDTEMLLVFVEDALTLADPELQITTAHTGLDGLKKVQEIVPDLVLIDYSLPDLNGDKVCRRLLEDERTAGIPVLMMSAHGAEMIAAAKRLPNIVTAIEKPFFSKQLVDLVQRTLAAPKRARSASRSEPATVPAPPVQRVAPTKATTPAAKPLPGPVPPRVSLSSLREATARQEAADTTAPAAHRAAPAQPTAPSVAHKATATGTPRRAPTIKPPPPPMLQQPKVLPKPAEVRLPPAAATQTILSMYLEVVSMQVTPQFEMRSIRARPAAGAVALRSPTGAAQPGVARETGFQLGATELDTSGRISVMRLVPSSKPFQPAQIRTAFQIGSVAVVPGATRQRVQLTTAGTTPMMLQVIARPEVAGVKLSPTFQVGELVLKWRTNAVRVTLDPKAPEESGATFELSAVQLDNARRIVELLLNPVK
jgi:DNA-binding response OmpR family regulator